VVGPTQVGKSTIVNLLLQTEFAVTSPLAGFTRALHGFAVNTTDRQLAAVEEFFTSTDAQSYSLQTIEDLRGELSSAGYVVWDTPDFDSHTSRDYRNLIARVIALSDVVVLVVSKEKYADATVWQILDLFYPLGRTLLICLNKASRDVARLRQALQTRLEKSRNDTTYVPICDLPYVEDANFSRLQADPHTLLLRDTLKDLLHPIDGTVRREGIKHYLKAHWERWLQPVRLEHDAFAKWRRIVETSVEEAINTYQHQYLEHSQHYSTFNKTMVQLLELLEIPAIAKPLMTTRRILTWPFRKLLAYAVAPEASRVDVELDVLREIFDHLLLSLRRNLVEKAVEEGQQGIWWRAITVLLNKRTNEIQQAFLSATRDYQRAFETEIGMAARSLHQQLEQRPATLNSLRAARVTADAAGVALVFKTGGIGVNELVLTPAMLSLTSFLAESAVGKYMDSVKEELRTSQRAHVKKLIEQLCNIALIIPAEELQAPGLFSIARDELETIDQIREKL